MIWLSITFSSILDSLISVSVIASEKGKREKGISGAFADIEREGLGIQAKQASKHACYSKLSFPSQNRGGPTQGTTSGW